MDVIICEQYTLDKTKEINTMQHWYRQMSIYNMDELVTNDELLYLFDYTGYKFILLNTETGLYMSTYRDIFESDTDTKAMAKKKLRMPDDMKIDFIKGKVAVEFITRILDKLPFNMRVVFLQNGVFQPYKYDVTLNKMGNFLCRYTDELNEIILNSGNKSAHTLIARLVNEYNIEISEEAKNELTRHINHVAQLNIPTAVSSNLMPYLNDKTKDYMKAVRVIYNVMNNKQKKTFNDCIDSRSLVIYDDEESIKIYEDAICKNFPNIRYSLNDEVIGLIDRVAELDSDILLFLTASMLKRIRMIKVLPFAADSILPCTKEIYRIEPSSSGTNDWWEYMIKVLDDRGIEIKNMHKYKVATNKESLLVTQLDMQNYKLAFDILSVYTDPSQLDMEFTRNLLTNMLWYRTDSIDDMRRIIYAYRPMYCKEIQDMVVKAILLATSRLRKDSCKKLIKSLRGILEFNIMDIKEGTYMRDTKDIMSYISEMGKDINKISEVIATMILEGSEV